MPALTAFMMHPHSLPDLQSLKWRKRVVLVFAQAGTEGKEAEQRAAFEQAKKGFAERDLQVFYIRTDASKDAEQFRRSVLSHDKDAGGGFEVVLIGKDGGVKLRRGDVLPVQELFATIDAMPMRQDEMSKE